MDFESRTENEEIPSSGEEDNTDERKHNQLLDAISSLDGKKRQKLSQRTVISNQISEFNFTSSKDKEGLVKLHELVGSLKESTSHGELKNQLRTIDRNKKTVSTPLPRHEKEKIDRSTAYETTTEDISKWDPVVNKNRRAEQLQFPLQKQDFRIITTDQLVKRFKPRTPLERQVAELLQGSDSVVQNKEQELTPAEQRALKAMDLQEAKERRMELMKHRALLSYKESKAKRQKKIKSKRYHRILKKEKLKNEKKQLDKLQDDPEGYLDKLNQLEKDRAQERVSLKHRGGSKFAKRQMIYAKYDDRARQEVQDMLQKSRELTKKVDVESESDDEKFPDSGVMADIDVTELNSGGNSDNPWMARPTSGKPKSSFSRPTRIIDESEQSEFSRPAEMVSSETVNVDDTDSDVEIIDEITDELNDGDSRVENTDELISTNRKPNSRHGTEVHDLSSLDMKQVPNDSNSENGDNSKVSEVIDEIFDMASKQKTENINSKTKKKRNKKKTVAGKKDMNPKSKFTKQTGNKQKDTNDAIGQNHSDIDNEDESENESEDDLVDMTGDDNKKDKNIEEENDDDEEERIINSESLNRKRTLEDLEKMSSDEETEERISSKKLKMEIRNKKNKRKKSDDANEIVEKEAYVDPKKLFTMETKIRQVGSGPNIIDNEDDNDIDAEEQQRLTIAQAFADDDVIEEFSREKGEAVEKGKPKDIDLTLPGWGSWGGEGVEIPKRKRKRFTIKAPPPLHRKDEHLGHVILNESKMAAVSKHMVHEIPFPYKNVEQFEKSIRAPLGKTWHPESVHKELVKPKVVTGLGKIIAPMDKSEMFKNQKNKTKSDVDLNNANVEKKNWKKDRNKRPFKITDKSTKGNSKSKFKQGKKGSNKHSGVKK